MGAVKRIVNKSMKVVKNFSSDLIIVAHLLILKKVEAKVFIDLICGEFVWK